MCSGSACPLGGWDKCEFPFRVCTTLTVSEKDIQRRISSCFCSYNSISWGSSLKKKTCYVLSPLFQSPKASSSSLSPSSGLRNLNYKGCMHTECYSSKSSGPHRKIRRERETSHGGRPRGVIRPLSFLGWVTIERHHCCFSLVMERERGKVGQHHRCLEFCLEISVPHFFVHILVSISVLCGINQKRPHCTFMGLSHQWIYPFSISTVDQGDDQINLLLPLGMNVSLLVLPEASTREWNWMLIKCIRRSHCKTFCILLLIWNIVSINVLPRSLDNVNVLHSRK